MIPISDAIGVLSRLEAGPRFEAATRVANDYPIVQLVRVAPSVSDPIALAAISYAVQRRGTPREAFEAFVRSVDEDTLFVALEKYWAVQRARTLLSQYAELVGGGVLPDLSAPQTFLWFAERGAQPLTVAAVLATRFDDDEVLRALHENALGYRYAVALLRCIGWSRARVATALWRRGLLPFEIAMLDLG